MCNCSTCISIRDSAAVVFALIPGKGIRHLDATALGLAVTLDKPIILICEPGSRVPEKLAKVIDRFVEYDPDPTAVSAAIKDTLIDMGLINDVTDDKPSHN